MPTFQMPGKAVAAPTFESNGGTWDPDQHWTGDRNDRAEVQALQAIIDRYARNIAAYHDYEPFPGMYSLELQFDDDAAADRCRKDFHSLFDGNGKLKVKKSAASASKVAFVRVTPGQEPSIYETDQIDRQVIKDRIEEFLGDSPEMVPYPNQLKGYGSLGLFVIDRGIYKPTAYNRWGIVGPFAVAKFNVHGRIIPLTPKDVETIFEALRTSKGYLDTSCGIGSPFRGAFAEHGEPPSGAVPRAGRWFGH